MSGITRGSCAILLALMFSCIFFDQKAFADSNIIQQGKASWYGTTSHGNQTASGETFLRHDFSAAHKNLPFGTVVRVHNAANGRQVLVKVNDRGPYSKGRVIDLSKRAATNLKMVNRGVAPVIFETVTDVKGRPLNKKNSFYVRLAESDSAERAHKLASQLEKKLDKEIKAVRAEKPFKQIALCLGPFATFQEAERTVKDIEPDFTVKDIVEAPTAGGTIPFHRPPEKTKKIVASAEEKSKNSS